jgi:two-component system LytT family sensor kinase
MKKAWYANKWVTILLHVVAWVLLFSLPVLLRPSHDPNEAKTAEQINTNATFVISRISDALLIIFFYLNAGLLIPQLLYKRKFFTYTLSVISSFAAYVSVMWLLWVNFTHRDANFSFGKYLIFSFFILLFILACSTAYKTIRDKIISDQLAKEKETENLKTELSLLRSQVSPHFMFNVLNNMVSLARKQSDQLEPSLIKLSSLMRYMLYETDGEKVSLEKETEYLQSYIDLQQQRFGKKVIINTTICPADKMYEIEPMLLIPFVENAFKHGTGFIGNAQIDIELRAEKNILYFRVSNRYDPASVEIKDKASGIGLVNVQRRLELLHPGQHKLDITRDNCIFTVLLKINLT